MKCKQACPVKYLSAIALLCFFCFSCNKEAEVSETVNFIPEKTDTFIKRPLPPYRNYGQRNTFHLIILGDRDSDFWLLPNNTQDRN